MTRGLWITVEGGDGVGKGTQLARLTDALRARGEAVLTTREPGGSEIGQQLREIVLHHRGEIAPRAEALLFAADRAQHIATVVQPALAAGTTVVQDRYLDSSVAYQGATRALGADEVRDLSLWATAGALPDVTILLDLDPATAAARLAADDSRPFDRLEAEGQQFQRSVREAYLEVAAANPERIVVVDASGTPDEVASLVLAAVDAAAR